MTFKPCETSLAIHTDLHIPQLSKVKEFMKTEYGNTFDVDPHVTHLLFPIFENKFFELLPKLKDYLNNLNQFEVTLGDLEVEEKRRFFKINIDDSNLKKLHKDLLNMVLPYRENAVRKKDLERIETDYYNQQQKEYLNKYGYPRVLDLNDPILRLVVANSKFAI